MWEDIEYAEEEFRVKTSRPKVQVEPKFIEKSKSNQEKHYQASLGEDRQV